MSTEALKSTAVQLEELADSYEQLSETYLQIALAASVGSLARVGNLSEATKYATLGREARGKASRVRDRVRAAERR